MNTQVPFLDLITPHRALEDDLVGVFREALNGASFIGGPMVENFEHEFARFCGTKYCVGVGSGTDALRFALQAAGVRQGDAVVTTPFTFIATTEAITQAGARPVFVDIDPRTYNMDPEKLLSFLEQDCRRDAQTGKPVHVATGCPVTAVIPVHIYGQTADMASLSALADRHGLIVIEDACQAHGASCRTAGAAPKKAGSMGRAGAFSFYPGKNLGACGEGGAVTTNDEQLAATVRMLRDHGQSRKYIHVMEGYNGRLDAIQAGILSVKLRSLEAWNGQRRKIAERYNELLREVSGIILPVEPEWSTAVYHLYCIRSPQRSELQSFLAEKGIGTGLHYPIPLHLQQAYAGLGYQTGDFPVAEGVSREILSLPMHPGLSEIQQLQVVESITAFSKSVPQPA